MENVRVELLQQGRDQSENQTARSIAHRVPDIILGFESACPRNKTLFRRLCDVLIIAHNSSLIL